MAGSWKHFVDKKGRFKGSGELENGGDVVEALEEAYGMVWYLSTHLAVYRGADGQDAAALVEEAERAYRDGLRWSPGYTKKAAEQGIGRAEDWGQR
jgi:hypothetical protein